MSTTPGRNDPCPCGSGRKYKVCCLPKTEAARVPLELAARAALELLRYADRRFGRRPVAELQEALFEAGAAEEELPDFLVPVACYQAQEDGRPIAAWYLAEARPDEALRRFVEAQLEGWLSVWEVTAVEPGTQLALTDLLTGTTRVVRERTASRLLTVRDAVLARVVAAGDHFELDGMHGRRLHPEAAAEVIAIARKALRKRTRPVEPEKLRSEEAAYGLASAWRATVDRVAARPPPVLQNTDGDPLLFTRDVHAFDPARREAVRAALKASGGEPESGDPANDAFVFEVPGNPMHPDWTNTIVGRAVVGRDRLVLETNSVRRADRLRAQVAAACGPLVRFQLREHQDPSAAMNQAGGAPRGAREPDRPLSDAEREAMRAFKDRHYRTWLDQPLPALEGATPRRAATERRLRVKLDAILKSIEQSESLERPELRFDAALLRRELGM